MIPKAISSCTWQLTIPFFHKWLWALTPAQMAFFCFLFFFFFKSSYRLSSVVTSSMRQSLTLLTRIKLTVPPSVLLKVHLYIKKYTITRIQWIRCCVRLQVRITSYSLLSVLLLAQCSVYSVTAKAFSWD